MSHQVDGQFSDGHNLRQSEKEDGKGGDEYNRRGKERHRQKKPQQTHNNQQQETIKEQGPGKEN